MKSSFKAQPAAGDNTAADRLREIEDLAVHRLVTIIEDDLIAEHSAIESYRAMMECLGERDPAMRRALQEIVSVTERNADNLAALLERLPSC